MNVPGYQVEGPLGTGGNASVYLAVQVSLHRRVALKLMRKFDKPDQAERFVQEGRVIASLSHRNIVTIHDIGTVDDRHFIAMEYLDGGSLAERIDAGMTLDAILALLEQLADCLDFVHGQGIVHRDIKPSNILFHADGTPKLTDFGIAKLVDVDQEVTADGSALGSPYYLSPEQAEGRAVDGRSDIYALGIVFHQMLTGTRPYAKSSPLETVVAHLTEPLPLLPEPLGVFQGLLDSMLAKRPEERIESARQLSARLRDLRERLPVDALHAMYPVAHVGELAQYGDSPARPRVGAWPVAVLAAGALGFAAWAALPWGESVSPDVASLSAPVSAPVSVLEPSQEPVPASAPETPELPLAMPLAPPLREVPVAFVSEPLPEIETIDADAIVLAWAARRPASPAPEPRLVPPAEVVSDTPVDSAPDLQPDSLTEPPLVSRITSLMRAGDSALDELRLTLPPDDNARDYYHEVLALDPQHLGARAGLDAVVARYAEMAHRALDRGQYDKARLYVHRGLQVDGSVGELHALRDDIDARQRALAATEEVEEPHAVAVQPPADDDGIVGREGTGNILKDIKSVWRAVFD